MASASDVPRAAVSSRRRPSHGRCRLDDSLFVFAIRDPEAHHRYARCPLRGRTGPEGRDGRHAPRWRASSGRGGSRGVVPGSSRTRGGSPSGNATSHDAGGGRDERETDRRAECGPLSTDRLERQLRSQATYSPATPSRRRSAASSDTKPLRDGVPDRDRHPAFIRKIGTGNLKGSARTILSRTSWATRARACARSRCCASVRASTTRGIASHPIDAPALRGREAFENGAATDYSERLEWQRVVRRGGPASLAAAVIWLEAST